MPDPSDQSEQPTPDEEAIRRGERVGGTIAFWLTFAPICLVIPFVIGGAIIRIHELIAGLLCYLVLAIIMAACGSVLGKAAAKCRSVNSAFLRGAIISVLTLFSIFIFFILLAFLMAGATILLAVLTCMLVFLMILTPCGALVSGVAAIYVRDFRQFQRKRWIPQFTLQELFIIFTIVGVFFAIITTLARLPK